MNSKKSFYQLNIPERLKYLVDHSNLSENDIEFFTDSGGLSSEQADFMVENVVGTFSLPLGIAQHFVVNDRPVFVPMVIEEPSVIAAASFMAKLAKAGGGFKSQVLSQIMIGQIQILDVPDINKAAMDIEEAKQELLADASKADPALLKLGGGPKDLEVRLIKDSPIGLFLVVHVYIDVKDAMGANAVNSALERISPMIEEITKGRVLLKILSNLADRRLVKASCTVPVSKLAFSDFAGEEVRDKIIEAWAFAVADPYRAATHNKGIMNGIDAVVIATGNDWRAVEAGAHAYAAHNRKYTSLTSWQRTENDDLYGEIELPIAVGIIGGATRSHPTAQAAIKLMGISTANELAEIIACVGLAQNLGALRALATEGIQRGHMSLHAKQVAMAAGAANELIIPLAEQMINESNIHINRAIEILNEWSQK